jgi:hypothetical protein
MHQTTKPKLESSLKIVSIIPKTHRVRNQLVRNTKSAEEKNVTPNNVTRLIQAIYDDVAISYKKACTADDKQRQQECLKRLHLVEDLLEI